MVYSDHAKIIVINRKWAVIWLIDNTTKTEQVNRKFVIIIRIFEYYFLFFLFFFYHASFWAEIR